MFSFGGFTTSCKTETGSYIDTAVIITLPASEQMSPYHDRQPLIIAKEDEESWLTAETEHPQEFLKTYFNKYAKIV